MALAKDFREFIELLTSHRVDFLVVGAHALAFHGHPRYTGDLDLWLRVSDENSQRLERAIQAFGFSSTGLTADDFRKENTVVQLGHPPLRIDLITSLTGLDFEDAWKKRVVGDLDGLQVFFLDRESLIRNKRATGRTKDAADAEALEK